VLEQLAHDYAGKLKFVAMDAYENMDRTSSFGVTGLPTMILFKDGKEAGRLVGAAPRDRIVAAIRQATGIS
jgi:thioredoxin 1